MQGLYAAPPSVAGGFAGLSRDQKYAALNTEPVKAMFRGGGTRNARLLGQIYPYNVASLPGMHNEDEQTAITEKQVLLHSYHAALSMFAGHGWTTKTLFEKVASGKLDQELCSFVGYSLCAADTLPSTQEYVSDYWLVPDPSHPPTQRGTAQWFALAGEDWQVANASMASWSPDQKWSPSGHDDCESKFHHILGKHLAFVEMSGGKGSDVIRNSVRAVRKAREVGGIVEEEVKRIVHKKAALVRDAIAEFRKNPKRPFQGEGGVVPAAASGYAPAVDCDDVFGGAYTDDKDILVEEPDGMRNVVKNVRTEVFKSETTFEDNIPVEACNSLIAFATFCKDYQPTGGEDEQTIDLVHGIALLSAINAGDFFELHGILGTAFGGKVGAKVKVEGGHMYGLQRLGAFSAILEGTASVENRMNFEHAEHTKSIMKFEKGLCTMMESVWLNEAFDDDHVGVSKLPIPKFKPMMTSSNIEHTEVGRHPR